MAHLTIVLPEEVGVKVRAKASRAGYASAEEYVQALLVQDAEDSEEKDYGAPEHLSFSNDEELEKLLLERLEGGPSIEATPEFWRSLEKQFARHQRKSKSA